MHTIIKVEEFLENRYVVSLFKNNRDLVTVEIIPAHDIKEAVERICKEFAIINDENLDVVISKHQ